MNKRLDHRHYDQVVGGESVVVLKPNGSTLCLFLKGVLPLDVIQYAGPSLRKAGSHFSNFRGFNSGVIGYLKGETRAFTEDHPNDYRRCLPFARACNSAYRRELPAQYELQRQAAEKTQQIIPGTIFTTGTINRWTADKKYDGWSPVHEDKNDEGFSVLSVLSTGNYRGGYTCFPKWRVAVDVRTTDLILFDPRELHGNVPIEGSPGWERLASIFYFRVT